MNNTVRNGISDGMRRIIFENPPSKYGMMPFWFWNDDLDERELLRQIREFKRIGLGGFVLHPRAGLSRRVGYLTPEFFRLVRLAVDEAARLGLKVILYDEGCFPSGSACGLVVKENPAFAARGIVTSSKPIPAGAQFIRVPLDATLQEKLLTVVVARKTGSESYADPQRVSFDLQGVADLRNTPKADIAFFVWEAPTGGTIRGAFEDADDLYVDAPAAGDLLNPDAVACFIRLTHDQYYKNLKKHFGKTIVAMFTDEPMSLGRYPRRHFWSMGKGLLDAVQRDWDGDAVAMLPALWHNLGPRTGAFRKCYDRALHLQLEKTFYAPVSKWCADHGIALTGHPEKSNDFVSLKWFQWPGQDMVLRWVLPTDGTALAGANSCAPRTATSAARVAGRGIVTNEVLGAYGWQLTMDEMKWLVDWHYSRGNNLLLPHAFYYSIRALRAYECEPDLGLHNAWYPYMHLIAGYGRRLQWLMQNSRACCDVGVVSNGANASWSAATVLMQSQIDFTYIDPRDVAASRLLGGAMRIGASEFRALVVDCDIPLIPAVQKKLAAFRKAGGCVVNFRAGMNLRQALEQKHELDVMWDGSPDLRVLHIANHGGDFYLLFNEGEKAVAGSLKLKGHGGLELWDPMSGKAIAYKAVERQGRLETRVRLERRTGLVLAVVPGSTAAAPLPESPGRMVSMLTGGWQTELPKGKKGSVALKDWSRVRGWELHVGTVTFKCNFRIAAEDVKKARFLDLGKVGDIAEVKLNGRSLGVRLWSPHMFALNGALQEGGNVLTVRVTNSMANRMYGMQMPSGLIGPVCLRTSIKS